jgi:crossover junction endodeoxyribonuclease RuvC
VTPASRKTDRRPGDLRVLGIDPGLTITGYGVVEGNGSQAAMVASGTVRTSTRESRAERLGRIFEAVRGLIEEHGPDELAIEQQFVAENVRSAMTIGEARAAALVAAAVRGVPVHEFQPRAVKESVVGFGGAPKEQVQQMVAVHLHLEELPSPMDVSDALAIALTRLAETRLEGALARSAT